MIQTDVLNCGEGSVGTWFDGCKITPKEFSKAFLLSPTANIDLADDDFDEAARALLIKNGQLVSLNDILQVSEGGAKNNFQTLPNKKKIYISQGLYEFMMQFEANICLVKALHKLTKKKWELLLLDTEGKLFFDNKNGKLNGFELQELSVDNETVNDGGSAIAMVNLTAQFTQDGTRGYNTRRSFLVSDEFYGIMGVQDVKIEAVVLAHVTFAVKVLSGCDNSTPVSGLQTANFRVRKASDGTNIAVTATEGEDGVYALAGIATAQDVLTQLWDATNSSPVTDLDLTQFFKSNVLASTLT